MEKVTQESKGTTLENQALGNLPEQQTIDAEAFKVNNNVEPSAADQERINAVKSELEEIARREAITERPNVHLGDNNMHLNNSVSITNSINNGGNSGGRNRESSQEIKEEPKGFIEKYFGKIGKGVFKLLNPFMWLKILTAKFEKK